MAAARVATPFAARGLTLGVGVAHHFIFDAVGVEEIETAAGFIIAMAERNKPGGDHARFGGAQIIDLDPDMV